MNSSFLQASLFASVMAFGVAAMAAVMGVLFVLIGLGMRDDEQRVQAARVGAPSGDEPPVPSDGAATRT